MIMVILCLDVFDVLDSQVQMEVFIVWCKQLLYDVDVLVLVFGEWEVVNCEVWLVQGILLDVGSWQVICVVVCDVGLSELYFDCCCFFVQLCFIFVECLMLVFCVSVISDEVMFLLLIFFYFLIQIKSLNFGIRFVQCNRFVFVLLSGDIVIVVCWVWCDSDFLFIVNRFVIDEKNYECVFLLWGGL